MISANELRIGNYVLDENGSPFEFEWLEGLSYTNSIKFIEIKYAPIPLTEEWLVKLGFTKQDEDHHELSNGRQSFLLERDQDGDFGLLYRGDFGLEYYYLCTPTVVHDLQNIYFCLTGKELMARESFTGLTTQDNVT